MKKILSLLVVCTFIMGISGCSQSSTSKQESQETVKTSAEKEKNQEKIENRKSDESEGKNKVKENKEEDVTVFNDGSSNTPKDEKNTAVEKVVVIDPGHGMNGNKEMEAISPDSNELKIKDPGGAQGSYTGVPEYRVNLQVAEKLKAKLEAKNIKVIMTKTQDSEDPGNIERADVANNVNAALEIRIHCDSAENSSAHGASMLVPGETGYAKNISSISRTYGETILDSLVKSAGMYNRGISVRDDLTGFNWSKVPIVLVEMGFMSNPDEDALLSTEAYQEKIAQGLCDGIVTALQ